MTTRDLSQRPLTLARTLLHSAVAWVPDLNPTHRPAHGDAGRYGLVKIVVVCPCYGVQGFAQQMPESIISLTTSATGTCTLMLPHHHMCSGYACAWLPHNEGPSSPRPPLRPQTRNQKSNSRSKAY